MHKGVMGRCLIKPIDETENERRKLLNFLTKLSFASYLYDMISELCPDGL